MAHKIAAAAVIKGRFSRDDRSNCGVDLCEVEFNLAQAQDGLLLQQPVYCGGSVLDQGLPGGLVLENYVCWRFESPNASSVSLKMSNPPLSDAAQYPAGRHNTDIKP